MRKVFNRGAILGFVLLLCGVGGWFVLSGTHQIVYAWGNAVFIEKTAKSGFVVENFLVDGREHTDGAALLKLTKVQKGDPIFSFDPVQAKALIEELPWVERAHVERRLPDTIYIRLYEREPVALWKDAHGLRVIDREGVVLTDKDIAKFAGLVMISGEKANGNVVALLAMMEAQPEIRERLDVAQWVEGRRWNLHLRDGKLVILPQDDPEVALARLVRQHNREGVLDKAITSIDARDPSRFIVQTERGKVQDLKYGTDTQQTSL